MLKISDIVNDALKHAETVQSSQSEKVAAESLAPQKFTSDLAGQLHKLAHTLKESNLVRVTHSDVMSFVKRMAG